MSAGDRKTILQASCVAITGRALALEGKPGVGKSSLALALIERGGVLIGDDAVTLTQSGAGPHVRLFASPPPNVEGLIEVRGVGLVRMPTAEPTPLALILSLLDETDHDPTRLPEATSTRNILNCPIPVLPFRPGSIAPVQRALHALTQHGLTV